MPETVRKTNVATCKVRSQVAHIFRNQKHRMDTITRATTKIGLANPVQHAEILAARSPKCARITENHREKVVQVAQVGEPVAGLDERTPIPAKIRVSESRPLVRSGALQDKPAITQSRQESRRPPSSWTTLQRQS